jgi:hypothetical protein
MISSQRSVTSRRPATAALSIPTNRSSHILPFAAASLAALVLSACGGGDGSGSSVDAAQSSGASDFRSFASVNPEVRAAVAAQPIAARPIAVKKADDADRAEDGTTEEDGEEVIVDGDGNDVDGDGNSSEDESANADDSDDDYSSSSIADTMVSDMREMNDNVLKGVNPKYGFSRGPGYVILGNKPGANNFVLPWFVQYEGEGNQARNTRIQMREMNVFVKSRSSGQWTKILNSNSYSGIQCDPGSNYYHCPQQAKVDSEDDGASSLPISGLNLHGWWGARAPIDSWDIAAMVVSAQARLVADTNNGNDDRHKANYLLHVGADYYPANAPPPEGLPPVGISRSKSVTNDWQTFTMTTFNDVGLQEPGGGISESELRADPPPLK